MTAQLTEAETITPVDATKEHATLAAALVAAQKEMPAVEPDAENPAFHSKFVSLSKLVSSVRPILNKHGIALTQMPSQDENGRPTLITRLVHVSGELTESEMPLLMEKTSAQGLGSALTYAKRYALGAALAIVDQEDDDGNAATTQASVAPASDKQIGVLGSALNWLLPPDTAAATWDGIKAASGGEITGPVANALILAIKARKDAEEVDQTADVPAEVPA